MKKVLFIVPHLSTGGMPQYTYNLMSKIINDVDVYCIEYTLLAWNYVVQRNRIKDLLGDKFYAEFHDKKEILNIINRINPDIIHFQELPEYFMDDNISSEIYKKNRPYLIVETSHDSSFNIESKRFYPDQFALISNYQKQNFLKLGIPISIVESDIEYKVRQDREEGLKKLGLDPSLKHVLNVGLFTSRKNQKEIFEYANALIDEPIQFHFVGNLADNFKDYWGPLVVNAPPNIKIWGERGDVDNFYSCMDLFLFTSRGNDNDKETSPLVIREAIGYKIPSLIYNLPVYMGMYDKYENVNYLHVNNFSHNINEIRQKLNLFKEDYHVDMFETLDGPLNLEILDYPNNMYETLIKHGDAAAMWWGTFIHKELDRGNVKVEVGDVFVDLGANIGVSSYYALTHGANKVYCFEPDQRALSVLHKNIKSNKESFNYAISNKSESIELYHWPHNPNNEGSKYKADCIPFNEIFNLVKEPIIDYLKIDIEGSEENIFDDTPHENMSRVRKMFIEYHNTSNTEIFVEKIKKYNFEVVIEYGFGQNYIYCYNKNFKLIDENDKISKNVAVSISTYTNNNYIVEKTIKCINSIKKFTDYSIICTDHNPAPTNLIKMCDHYFYDSNNILTNHTFYDKAWVTKSDFKFNLNLKSSKNNGYHGPAVHQNIYAGVILADMLKYDYVICMNFDLIINEYDSNIIKECIQKMEKENKNAFFLMTNETEGTVLKTVFFITRPKFYLDIFQNIKNAKDYEDIVLKYNSESNGLENLYFHILKNDLDTVIIENKSELDFFNSSNDFNIDNKSFTSSQTEYSAILPIKTPKNKNNVVFLYKSSNDIEFDYKWEVYSHKNKLIYEHTVPKYINKLKNNSEVDTFVDVEEFLIEDDKRYNILLKNISNNTIVKIFKNITIDDIKCQGEFEWIL